MEAIAKKPGGTRPNRFARACLSWALLVFAANTLRIVAVIAGILPPAAFSERMVGVGTVAACGAVIASLGVLAAAVRFRAQRLLWASPGFVLVVLSLVTLCVFPPRWVLDRLQTPETVFYVKTARPVFALTIDDGLDPVTTPLLLETLRHHEAKATFFVLGESIERFPDLARRCLEEGHELANHQMTDQPAVRLTPKELQRQMEQADALLRELCEPRWFRPGGGLLTDVGRRVSRGLGCRTALASVFPFDTHIRSVRFASAYVEGRCSPGDIVVLHDVGERGRRTSQVLEAVLPALAARGLTAVTLSDLAP